MGPRQMSPVEKLLNRLDNVKEGSSGWSARCPAHDDNNNSLSISEGEDRKVLLHCHAGCTVEQIVASLGISMRHLFVPRKEVKVKKNRRNSKERSRGLTLEEYAEAKKLPTDFLGSLEVSEIYLGGPAIRVPYFDHDRNPVAVRFRLSLKGDGRFRWKNHSKPIPYGLWRLKDAREAGQVTIVEGESDAQTLWFHGIPALGLPGANSWKEEWAHYLDGIGPLYVVVEPDKGGEAVLKSFAASSIRDRIRVVRLTGAKDPSALYLKNPKRFRKRWEKAIRASRPLSAIENAQTKETRKAAWALCKELARDPNILKRFANVLRQRGAAGVSRKAKILYLALTSRNLERLVSIGLKGPSSGGKSYLLASVLAFFPEKAYYALTAMSDKALAYSDEPLSHRFVVLYEAAALGSEWAAYFVRSLLSEGRLVYETVEKTPRNGMRSRRIAKDGPTGLITTTTAVSLHPENETRYFSLRVSDSRKQTMQIMAAAAQNVSGKADAHVNDEAELMDWVALQEWLDCAEHRVVVPFAQRVAKLMPPVAVRLRRDFPAVMSLIQAHALLHQKTRKRDEQGRIIATLRDYIVVRELIKGVIAEAAEQSVPKSIRETVEAVMELLKGSVRLGYGEEPSATIAQIGEKLGLDRSAAYRRVQTAEHRGYLENLEPIRKGKLIRVRIGDPLPDGDKSILPSVKSIRRRLKNQSKT
jgi:hypothetical protein